MAYRNRTSTTIIVRVQHVRFRALLHFPSYRCCRIGAPPLSWTPQSTLPRTGGLPPEQVNPPSVNPWWMDHLLGGPDGRSAGPVTSLGRARLRLGLGARG